MAVEAETIQAPGTIDLWGMFHLFDKGREVRCTSATTLLYYLLSRGTMDARIGEATVVGIPRMTLTLTGPRAEDGKPLTLSYTLNSGEFGRLPEEDRNAFSKRLAELCGPLPWHAYAVLKGAR